MASTIEQLEQEILDYQAQLRKVRGSTQPEDLVARGIFLDLICERLKEMVRLRRACHRAAYSCQRPMAK